MPAKRVATGDWLALLFWVWDAGGLVSGWSRQGGTGLACGYRAAAFRFLFIAITGAAFTADNSTDRLRAPFPTHRHGATAAKLRPRLGLALVDLWFILRRRRSD